MMWFFGLECGFLVFTFSVRSEWVSWGNPSRSLAPRIQIFHLESKNEPSSPNEKSIHPYRVSRIDTSSLIKKASLLFAYSPIIVFPSTPPPYSLLSSLHPRTPETPPPKLFVPSILVFFHDVLDFRVCGFASRLGDEKWRRLLKDTPSLANGRPPSANQRPFSLKSVFDNHDVGREGHNCEKTQGSE